MSDTERNSVQDRGSIASSPFCLAKSKAIHRLMCLSHHNPHTTQGIDRSIDRPAAFFSSQRSEGSWLNKWCFLHLLILETLPCVDSRALWFRVLLLHQAGLNTQNTCFRIGSTGSAKVLVLVPLVTGTLLHAGTRVSRQVQAVTCVSNCEEPEVSRNSAALSRVKLHTNHFNATEEHLPRHLHKTAKVSYLSYVGSSRILEAEQWCIISMPTSWLACVTSSRRSLFLCLSPLNLLRKERASIIGSMSF